MVQVIKLSTDQIKRNCRDIQLLNRTSEFSGSYKTRSPSLIFTIMYIMSTHITENNCSDFTNIFLT